MGLSSWSKAEVEYGRKVLDSGLEGARSGREAFLSEHSLTTLLSQSVEKALKAAAVGACIGAVGSQLNGSRSLARMTVLALAGSALGFALGVAWSSRGLTASVVSGALRSIGKTRDAHWLERHPIDYA